MLQPIIAALSLHVSIFEIALSNIMNDLTCSRFYSARMAFSDGKGKSFTTLEPNILVMYV